VISALLAKRKKRLVMARKISLSHNAGIFQFLPHAAFIFQTFNKRINITPILAPFVRAKAKNISPFADGCVDGSADKNLRFYARIYPNSACDNIRWWEDHIFAI